MIEVTGLSFSYGRRQILKDISFSFSQGECVAVLGDNGAGKSTLITCLNRIRRTQSGQVSIDGTQILKMPPSELARNVSYVAQKNEQNHTTVFDAVLLGRKPYIRWAASEEDLNIVENALEAIGLGSMRLSYLDELSGGELQKVMIARAIAQEPKLMLLDEPTSNLAPRNQHESMALIQHCAHGHGIGVLVVLHDLNLAMQYCDRFLFLKDGKVFRYGDLSVVTETLLEDIYQIPVRLSPMGGQMICAFGGAHNR